MTLDGVIDFILRYVTEFDSYLQADYVTVVEANTVPKMLSLGYN